MLGSSADDALFLDDRYSRFPGAAGPRLSGIEWIAAGDGNDIVDLTSFDFVYGAVTLAGGEGQDVLWSSAGDDRLLGEGGDDQLFGGQGSDDLDGGPGDDLLQGDIGDDRYRFGLGYGQDVIAERNGNDCILFGEGIEPDRLWLQRQDDDLLLTPLGSSDTLTIESWYVKAQYRVERLETSSGAMLLEGQVQQLVEAMAAFTLPAGGELIPGSAVAEEVLPVIASSWQMVA